MISQTMSLGVTELRLRLNAVSSVVNQEQSCC